MNGALSGVVSVLVAIVGVAALAVIFSNNANTAGVITATGGALSTGIAAAVAPVTSAGGVSKLTPLLGHP